MRLIRSRSSIAGWALIAVSTVAALALTCPAGTAESIAPAQPAAPEQAKAQPQARAQPQAEARLLGDIKYLASDELEGRGIGTEGLNKAAAYIRHEFQAAGLDVTRVHGDAFQKFHMSIPARLGTPNSLTFIGPDGKSTVLKQDVDFRPCSFGGAGKIQGELAFGGYAIDSKTYHDLNGVDFKGKAVIVMRHGPRQQDSARPFTIRGDDSRGGDLRTKLSNAAAAGASALLIVNDPTSIKKNAKENESQIRWATNRVVDAALALEQAAPRTSDESQARKELSKTVAWLKKVRADAANSESNDPLMTFGSGGRGKDGEIPVVQLSVTAANRVLKAATGKSLDEFEAAINRDLKPRSTVLDGWKADGATTIKRSEVEVKNVIGVLEGAGPHADETVVIGAHYDHLGRGGSGSGSLLESSHEIHNGADDNASGTCALIELARHFGHQAKRLPRRLVFITFTGEEEGLIGSLHYVRDPVFPLAKTVAMLNLDMVGRLREDTLTVYGLGTGKHFKELVERTTTARHFKLIPKPEGFGPSDHTSFYAKKIPVLFFFTGTHPDYHRPTDDWQKINIPGMDRIVDLVEEIATTIVTAPERPDYFEVNGLGTVDRGGSRPYFGSIPDFSSEKSGYSISGVAPDSPADRAGLKGGDRIIQMGDRKITGLDDFDLVLRRFSAGDEIPVVAIRGGKTIRLKVTLGKPK
jgi:Peptidase family M28/PDZ domain/PA domain